MIMKEGKLKGIFEIQLEPHKDSRGFFARTYDEKIFQKHGLNTNWVQENHSFSREKNTIRGLHFQLPPATEAKLVRAASGEAFMVAADLRKGSATFGKWYSMIVSEKNMKMLYVPKGFALGMCSMADRTTLLYKMDNYYNPEQSGTIKWNDAQLGIKWPAKNPILSDKDAEASSFKEFVKKYGGLQI